MEDKKVVKTDRGIFVNDVTESVIATTKELEKIAWQVFQNRLGLRFKRELNADEKKKITDEPDYQQYRDVAKKIYSERLRKQEKAVLNKKKRF